MVETQLTCQSCGQHFETKSDLQEHEEFCLGLKEGQKQGQKQGQTWQRQTGHKSRTAGGGSEGEASGA